MVMQNIIPHAIFPPMLVLSPTSFALICVSIKAPTVIKYKSATKGTMTKESFARNKKIISLFFKLTLYPACCY